MLEVFGLSNAELGDIFAFYGVLAMLAYAPGGWLADRFAARKLMALALLSTAAGGLYFARLPGVAQLKILYAYWGITSILLLWAAMIRATREWGADTLQGRAFGALEAGRGLTAALASTLAVALFSTTVDGNAGHAAGLQRAIYCYCALTAATAGLVWWLIPESNASERPAALARPAPLWASPILWLQALIVVCAYCGYKGLDNYGLYAASHLGMSDVETAVFTSSASYLRAAGAIVAGVIADRWQASRTIAGCFFISLLTYLAFNLFGNHAPYGLLMANILVSFFTVFAIRGVYFALLAEGQIAKYQTGLAAGLVSLIGFTPDIFFAAITGRILDSSAGFMGYFWFLAACATLGLAAAWGIGKKIQR